MADIDHINGNREDNRIENLREATRQQNLFNKRSTRGLPKNVYSSGERYRVKMKVDGVTKHYGYFETLEQAAGKAAEVQKFHHGEFASGH